LSKAIWQPLGAQTDPAQAPQIAAVRDGGDLLVVGLGVVLALLVQSTRRVASLEQERNDLQARSTKQEATLEQSTKQVATLDLLSGGRVDFGVGKGYRQAEFDGFCIPIDEATERFDEAMEVIKKGWVSEGRFSHHGKRWRYDNIVVEPAPLQRPHPPLWLAAGSPDSIRRAAREGYNLLLDQLGSVDLTIERVSLFRDECRRIGRAYDPAMIGVTRALQIVRDEAERQAAYDTRNRVVRTIGDLARGGGTIEPPERDDARLLGTPAEIVARIRRLRAGGVENILLVDPAATVASLRTFAGEIMPAFADDALVSP